MKSLKTYISILKRVKNRPTKYFLFLVIAVVSLFLQAYMHNYNIVFIVMFFLVATAGVASVFGILNLYYIKVELFSHKRFFAHENSEFTLSIGNTSQNVSYDMTLLYKDEIRHIKSIKPQHTIRVFFKEIFTKRGENTLANIRLSSFFPLPHELKYKDIKLDKKIIVYAKPEGVSLFKFYNKNNSINGEIDEFDGVKEFNEGDSISYIHWASLAKTNSLMLKNFIYEDETKKLHFNFKAIKADVEEKLSQLTLWVLECEKYNLDFSIELNDEVIESKKVGIDDILKTIAKY